MLLLLTVLLGSPTIGLKGEWLFVTKDMRGDEFFVDSEDYSRDQGSIFFRGLRNYTSPEQRYGSLSSVGEFEADCYKGGIRLHKFEYYTEKMGKGNIINSFPITDESWFNPRQGTVGMKQLETVCSKLNK